MPPATAHLAQRAVSQAESKLGGVDLGRLIRPWPTLSAVCLALLSVAALAGLTAAAPHASAIAAQRWLMPLGSAHWPDRQAIQPLTQAVVHPVDGKVRLRAKVSRGFRDGMKMTIAYRVRAQDGARGEWTRVRVAEQRTGALSDERGVFETLVEVPAPVARSLMSGEQQRAVLEYRFEAGDAQTAAAELTLAARPEVVSVVVNTAPPAYARGLVGEQTFPLHEQEDRVATASAYIGSQVSLRVGFNKPVPLRHARRAAEAALTPDTSVQAPTGPPAQAWGEVSIRYHTPQDAGDHAQGFTLTGTLVAPALVSFRLSDEYGLTSTGADRLYRLQTLRDEPPMVTLLDPMVDESVLPTARVGLQAVGEDDIAMQELRLQVAAPDRDHAPSDAGPLTSRFLDDPALRTTGRFGRLGVTHAVELETLGLLPGDEVFITAIGQDVYHLDGQRHDPARSATRRLRVITEQELADQLRRVLRGVRDTAQSLGQTQRVLRQRSGDGVDPAEAAAQQGEVSRRITAQREQVQALQRRMDRNRAADLDALQELLNRADGLLDHAEDLSGQAQAALGQAGGARQRAAGAQRQQEAAEASGDLARAQEQQRRAEQATQEQGNAQEQAGEAQEQVQRDLSSLVAALDMGESIGEVASRLSALRRDAERVAGQTQQLLPQTIGQPRESLPEAVQDALARNAADQREIAGRAEALLDQMRATAQQIAEQGEQQGATPQQRAAARTMQEAAEVGERQGLEENTQRAAERLDDNQIAEAAVGQQQAMSALDQMLAEMGRQSQRRQEELRRLLQELAQKVQRLVDDQQAQLERLQAAGPDGLAGLEPALIQLRRRVMLVEEEAIVSPETASAGESLGQAVSRQAAAVRAVRANDRDGAEHGEAEALDRLQEALRRLSEAEQQQQQDQRRAERAALRQAYYDLADRQAVLQGAVSQHERDEAYGRRDWRQINRLHAEALQGAAFDAAQGAIQAAAQALGGQVGDAMVYQSLHRRIDQAAGRAQLRLRGRRADGQVTADQGQVASMLRAMGDALDEAGQPDKFERDQQASDGGSGGEGQEPPLVPDLAEIKLLRGVQIDLRRQTEALDGLTDQLSPQAYRQRLEDLAEQQRELGQLGGQLVERLQQRHGGQAPQSPESPPEAPPEDHE